MIIKLNELKGNAKIILLVFNDLNIFATTTPILFLIIRGCKHKICITELDN